MLAREVDFFSIGTNDLIQYSLAVDRNNEHVASLYQPLHPAILRMLRFVAESGRAAGIPVSLCGEMAADEEYLPLLVGLGLRRLSAHPRSIARLRQAVTKLDSGQLAEIAEECCAAASAEQVKGILKARLAASPAAN
jgi:phosphotransferase system enzyme I (PtsI)